MSLLLPIHGWGRPSDIRLAFSRTLCWVQGLCLERVSVQGTGHQSCRFIFSSSCPSTKQVSIRANLEFASKDFLGCLGDILQQCWAPSGHHHAQRQPCPLLVVLVLEEPGRTEVSQAPCTQHGAGTSLRAWRHGPASQAIKINTTSVMVTHRQRRIGCSQKGTGWACHLCYLGRMSRESELPFPSPASLPSHWLPALHRGHSTGGALPRASAEQVPSKGRGGSLESRGLPWEEKWAGQLETSNMVSQNHKTI